VKKLKPPYKNEGNNWYTAQLFKEKAERLPVSMRSIEPVFSFNGFPGYIDARKTFVELRDPTGVKWAKKYLGSVEHFRVLKECEWYKHYYDQYVEEIKAVFRSEAIEKLQEILTEGQPAQQLAAAKYLAEAGWEVETKQPKRGRPSKGEVEAELKRVAKLSSEEQDDLERIGGLSVIKGGKN
jgi:hypothetical protein